MEEEPIPIVEQIEFNLIRLSEEEMKGKHLEEVV